AIIHGREGCANWTKKSSVPPALRRKWSGCRADSKRSMISSGTSIRRWRRARDGDRREQCRAGEGVSTSRYPALTWPWVGVLLCLALLGQEWLLRGAGPNAALTGSLIGSVADGVS